MKFNRVITLSETVESHDDTGGLVITTNGTHKFKGAVKELKKPATESGRTSFTQVGDRLRQHRLIEITCYSKSVRDVVIGSEVTISGINGTYTVTDFYELLHDRYTLIIAEYRA